jgi:hypothetical protein
LDGWKEVAAHLRRDERTVQRWERERGLPIRRSPGKRGVVFAYAAEIDRWLTGNPNLSEDSSSIAQPATSQQEVSGSKLSFNTKVVAGVCTAVALAIFALFWVRTAFTSGVFSSVEYKDGQVIALDQTGHPLWTRHVGNDAPNPRESRPATIRFVGDLNGDGRTEALVSGPFIGDPGGLPFEDEVHCFDAAGKPLWSYRLPETFRYGSGQYGPPWRISSWINYRAGGKSRIVLALKHKTWWPSPLVILNANGGEMGRFVHSGYIEALSIAGTAEAPVWMAGGVDNSHDRSAMLAILDANHPSGSSPTEKTEFECQTCPDGRPLHYFVFPRSELNLVTGTSRSWVRFIHATETGYEIQTQETSSGGSAEVFEFTKDFQLLRASYSDVYWEMHRQLEREGKIHHTREQCPEWNGPATLLSWDQQHGWTTIHINVRAKSSDAHD